MARNKVQENYKPGKEEGKRKKKTHKGKIGMKQVVKGTAKGKVKVNPNKEKWHLQPKK